MLALLIRVCFSPHAIVQSTATILFTHGHLHSFKTRPLLLKALPKTLEAAVLPRDVILRLSG
jgi:predicted phosphodiesterase